MSPIMLSILSVGSSPNFKNYFYYYKLMSTLIITRFQENQLCGNSMMRIHQMSFHNHYK